MVSCFCLLLIMIVMRLIYHSLNCCGRVLRRQTLQSWGGHDKNARVRFLFEKRGDATAAFSTLKKKFRNLSWVVVKSKTWRVIFLNGTKGRGYFQFGWENKHESLGVTAPLYRLLHSALLKVNPLIIGWEIKLYFIWDLEVALSKK